MNKLFSNNFFIKLILRLNSVNIIIPKLYKTFNNYLPQIT